MEIILSQPYSYCQLGKRGNQEDARYPDENVPERHHYAFIVCDGVGGQDKGEVASRTVADAMGSYMEGVDLSKPFGSNDFSSVLDHAYSCLFRKMNSHSQEMATTFTFVCFSSSGVLCAHMGDSRIYHIRPGVGIMYQSEDHSLVNTLVHSGNLLPEEAINHPNGNIITRCMAHVEKGERKPSATTILITDVEPGDYFFLCTDGVTHCIDDEELISILSSDVSDKEKIDILSEKSEMSCDNNTAYLVGIDSIVFGGIEEIEDEESESEDLPITEKIDNTHSMVQEVSPSEIRRGNSIVSFFKNLFG